MINNAGNEQDRTKITQAITGPYRTMGSFSQDPDLAHAPSWWRGEEEAYESTMAGLMRLGPRRRRR